MPDTEFGQHPCSTTHAHRTSSTEPFKGNELHYFSIDRLGKADRAAAQAVAEVRDREAGGALNESGSLKF